MTDSSIKASICPLCGRANQCPMVAEPDASSSWCEDKFFPPELMAQVPEGAVRKASI